MSFGGGGGGFSFGSNNPNPQSGGFGGFGNNANSNTGGFGSNTSNTGGFGSSTAASNPFGSSTFGSNTNTGGFGTNTSTSGSLFASKPASNPFGSTTTSNTGGGLFGSSTANTGGFGSGSSGFGSGTTGNAFGNTSGSSGFSFGGAAKPAFGATTNSAPLFGQGGAGTTGGFGSSSSPFGASGNGTALSNQPVPPSEGTAVTPYVPSLEKEAAGVSSNYQSINFMPAYQRYSFEELRLADYNAGRRYGNSTGQAGGFGSSTFGGFGSTNTGAFGTNTNTTSSNPFGAATTAPSSGFGNNTATTGFGGGGLFGAKPAGTSLFTTPASSAPSGGLFGAASNTASTAFGGSGSAGFGASSGGGLFGNTQTQQKPSLFGNSSTNTGSSFSFGGNASSNTNTGGGLFGNANPSNTTTLGGTQPASGGFFGNNNTSNQQAKPSLFGTNTGAFGTSTNQAQPSGGLFGGNTSTNTSGGLFGSNSNTGAFGTNNNTNSNTGGGLFGSASQQKPGGLFGGSTFQPNNNQQSGGLFSGTGNTGSGFSFGNSANKPATGSLFGPSTQQPSGLGASMFAPAAGSQNTQQQADSFRVSSLNDPNPYGQTSIWTGLPVPTPDNSKPLFTPLSATQKLKESQSKPPPSLRLNQSRYQTPPRRSGYGFSYSTYGTPSSAASTPGGVSLNGSMYGSRSFQGGSFGRSFGKSASVSNLRSHFNADGNGVLSPDAFVAANTRWSSGNMRRLTIDRSIRNDLFSRPSLPAFSTNSLDRSTSGNDVPAALINDSSSGPEPIGKLKKRVSFDKDTTGGHNGASNGSSAAVVSVRDDDSEDDRGTITNGSATPEADLSRGKELAVVPEDRESDDIARNTSTVQAKPDPQPGDYWMKPSRAELSKIPREKLSRFAGFEVGRRGCGKVRFDHPVDLNNISLDDLYEKLVEIRLRSVTVYPDPSMKPAVGRGLNVPSTISIENSWPRNRGQPSSATSGPIFEKHVNRLKKMKGTEFVKYEITTGVWTFRVPHYTRYGLDYDEDEDDEMGQSQLSAPPDSLTSSRSADNGGMYLDSDEHEDYEDDEDDTFAFKQKTLPGGYGRQSAVDYENEIAMTRDMEDGQGTSDRDDENADDEDINEVSMAGSYPPALPSPTKPVLKASMMRTPGKALINIDGDWAEQLQRTISPRKQNRDALRDVQSKVLLDQVYEPIKPKSITSKNAHQKDFRTSIDIMHSLFNRHEERMADLRGKKGKAHGEPDFEFPYAKRAKTFDDQARADATELSEHDKLWHATFKPHFTPANKLIHKSQGSADDGGWTSYVLAHSEATGTDVVLTSLEAVNVENVTMEVRSLLEHAKVSLDHEIPCIRHIPVDFSQIKTHIGQLHGSTQELDIYELLHALFDEYDDEFTVGLTRQQKLEYQPRIRKDRLSKFVTELVWRRHGDRIQAVSKVNAATAAVMNLTAKNVHTACDALMQEKNFHLSLLVAQIEQADAAFQEDIAVQISGWREHSVLSEMSEEIRALYEILSGNTNIAQGKQNVPVEDRASTFAISEKFELDWVQAFGLCLWYGKHKNGDIAEVVAEFQHNLDLNVESATPIDSNGKEDPLWVVLKIFASNIGVKSKGRTSNAAVVDKPLLPQALSAVAQPFHTQTAFRLHHVVAAVIPGILIDQDAADNLALSLAFEDSARANLAGAAYALLHISNSAQREHQIRELLNGHAATLPAPIASQSKLLPLWTALTVDLQIPATWIYQSKALYARSCNDALAELRYLILATDYAGAHDCLLGRVAPRLVIDEDWESLRNVLAQFGKDAAHNVDTASLLADQDDVGTEWKNGGQVYADFVDLMALMDSSAAGSRRRSAQLGANGLGEKTALLQRLQTALVKLNAHIHDNNNNATNPADMNKDREKLEERVALCEMGKAVARVIELEAEDGLHDDKKAIFELPLTSDAKLAHVRTMGVDYFRGVMAMAR